MNVEIEREVFVQKSILVDDDVYSEFQKKVSEAGLTITHAVRELLRYACDTDLLLQEDLYNRIVESRDSIRKRRKAEREALLKFCKVSNSEYMRDIRRRKAKKLVSGILR